MNESKFRDYMVDVAERLEVLSVFLSKSVELASKSRINQPVKIKYMIDSIISDELLAMSDCIIDEIDKGN